MKVNSELVKELAQLSFLSFSVSEAKEIEEDLSKMIAFVEKLNEVEVAEDEAQFELVKNVTGLRADVVKNGVSVTEALKNAPQKIGDFFCGAKSYPEARLTI